MSTQPSSSEALNAAILRILRSLARVGLRHGVPCDAFIDIVKRAHIEASLADFAVEGRKPSISRVAVLTGLTRKDIARLLATPGGDEGDTSARYNRAARVVAGWVRDPDFATSDGAPAELALDEGTASFAQLVRRYSGDMPARAVLDELQRVGVVAATDDSRVRLLTRAYVPVGGDVDKLQILGMDVAALVDTIDHNMQHGATDPRFQRKVMYDNLPVEAVAAFRELSARQAQQLIEQMDTWLAAHDRDVNPEVPGTGRASAGLGIYYFEPPVATETKAEN